MGGRKSLMTGAVREIILKLMFSCDYVLILISLLTKIVCCFIMIEKPLL